ncbi:MAG: hypothetical protein ACHQK8_04830 [Bacteroidia bacterium]
MSQLKNYFYMNALQLLGKIKIQLSDLDRTCEELLAENRDPSAADRDLLKKQCLELYEQILKLPAPLKEKKVHEPVKETLPAEMSMEEFEVKEANIVSKVVAGIPDVKVEIPEVKPEIIETPQPKKEPVSLNEPKDNMINIPHTEVSLHEKISVNKQSDLNEKITESRVESLKAAIGLNKKISLVNELFRENTVEYTKAIDKLNSSPDLNEALRYLNELKHHYSWKNDDDLVVELEQLVQKRFR